MKKLNHKRLAPNVLSAAWRLTCNHNGRISARLDGRVAEVLP